MTSIKANATGQMVRINCPVCNHVSQVPRNAVGGKHRCKVRCACNNVFIAEVEYREKFRKKVDLPGFYDISLQKMADVEAGAAVRWESVAIDRKVPNCQVIDISRTGIGFLVTDSRKVLPGDVVRLHFKLDNTAETEIVQECEVMHVKDNFIGGRMLTENVSLGFYLLG